MRGAHISADHVLTVSLRRIQTVSCITSSIMCNKTIENEFPKFQTVRLEIPCCIVEALVLVSDSANQGFGLVTFWLHVCEVECKCGISPEKCNY